MKITYFFLLLLILNLPAAFAEDLLITLTDSKIFFDGKWTDKTEWKKSSETIIEKDSQKLFFLRYAHDYENIFLLIDVIFDTSVTDSNDKAIVCFKNKINENNSSNAAYCFEKSYDRELKTFVKNPESSEFKQIENPSDILAFSDTSNEFDRYSKIPHVSYEFKIPIDVIGRSHTYEFYVEVFDGTTQEIFSLTKDSIETESFLYQSENWTELISPDKSIPEFPFPIFILGSLFAVILIFSYNKKISFNLFNL